MNNREYIEPIKSIVKNQIESKKAANEVIDRFFYESIELKEMVRTAIQALIPFGFKDLSDENFLYIYKIAINEVRASNKTSIVPSISLKGEHSCGNDWLNEIRVRKIGWDSDNIRTYRDRYFRYLEKIGRTSKYIAETKRSSFDIIKKIDDPLSSNSFFSKGLVVGSVQSGKTANFNAVINSAIDVGYKLIIVLSGIMEDLRVQTQKRIEKEVVGKYVKGGQFIGVAEEGYSFGELGILPDVPQIEVPTSIETDFKKTLKEADFSLNNKNILICKKNTSVLKNLILWLDSYSNENVDKIDIPILIIDDEADNASLNNMGSMGCKYASTINGHIRALLALFKKRAYIGYTATPFANVLQDRNEKNPEKWSINDSGRIKEFDQVDNLFPTDFIELLFPPSNYIGAKHFFETRLSDINKIDPLIPMTVNDHIKAFPNRVYTETGMPTTKTGSGTRAVKKDDNFPKELPESLKTAIKCFVISIAIRTSRKPDMLDSSIYQPHNTMLIHISRFTTWQDRTKKLVQAFVSELVDSINNDMPNDINSIYGDLERTWNRYYAYVIENIRGYLPDDYVDEFLIRKTFNEIKPLLVESVKNLEVKAINSFTKDSLDYPDIKECKSNSRNEKSYIAIGGNRLSRGFTLEGLTINYFVRNTNLADTLLQMGRWFGYRPGYIDCCKLFASEELLSKFDQVTATIEDLEQRFIEMNQMPPPDNTPDKFAIRVLKHPGVLKITRAQILKNAKTVQFSYSDHLIQTTEFLINPKLIERAWLSFNQHIGLLKDFFNPIYTPGFKKPSYYEYRPDSIDDVFKILSLPNTYDFNEQKNGSSFWGDKIEFIQRCNQQGKLKDWSIVIKAHGSGNALGQDLDFPFEVKTTKRSGPATGRWRDNFLQNHVFTAGGSSKNIFNGGNDFKIRLSSDQIQESESNFRNNIYSSLKEKYPDESEERIKERVAKTTVPEKVYRRAMTDKEGVLVIYLIDLEKVFQFNDQNIVELENIRRNIDTKIPLIGYALGIPPVSGDISGEYLQSKFHTEIQEYEESTDEFDEVLKDD